MRNALRNRLKRSQKKQTAVDVIRTELKKAHDIHPATVFPGSVICALEEAGFLIIAQDDLDDEIALAYQAGVDSVTEA